MNYYLSHLLYLIRLGKRTERLQIQDLGHIRTGEDVMTALDSFGETEMDEERLQISKTNVCVRGALKNSQKDGLTHTTIIVARATGA